jgi:hypothetical protein
LDAVNAVADSYAIGIIRIRSKKKCYKISAAVASGISRKFNITGWAKDLQNLSAY